MAPLLSELKTWIHSLVSKGHSVYPSPPPISWTLLWQYQSPANYVSINMVTKTPCYITMCKSARPPTQTQQSFKSYQNSYNRLSGFQHHQICCNENLNNLKKLLAQQRHSTDSKIWCNFEFFTETCFTKCQLHPRSPNSLLTAKCHRITCTKWKHVVSE